MSPSDVCQIPYLRTFAQTYGFDPDEFIIGLVEYSLHSPRSFQEVVEDVTSTIVRLSWRGDWT